MELPTKKARDLIELVCPLVREYTGHQAVTRREDTGRRDIRADSPIWRSENLETDVGDVYDQRPNIRFGPDILPGNLCRMLSAVIIASARRAL